MSDDDTGKPAAAPDSFADLFKIPPGTPPVLINAKGEPGNAERCKAEFAAWRAEQKRKRQAERRRGHR